MFLLTASKKASILPITENSVIEGHKREKEKTVARVSLSRVQELSGSDTDTRESDDDTSSSSHGSDDQGGTGGQETTVYGTATG